MLCLLSIILYIFMHILPQFHELSSLILNIYVELEGSQHPPWLRMLLITVRSNTKQATPQSLSRIAQLLSPFLSVSACMHHENKNAV